MLVCGMWNPVVWDRGLGGSIEAAYEPNNQATNTTQLNTTVLSPPQVLNAQKAGYKAAIVHNVDSDDLISMGSNDRKFPLSLSLPLSA